MARFVCLGGAAGVTALLAASVGSGAESASRIIDRTIVCRMIGQGFPDAVRFIGASARPYDAANDVSPSVGLGNSAGHGGSSVGAGMVTGPRGAGVSRTASGEVSLTRTTGTRCTATKLRIPLSRAALQGGLTSQTGDYYRCDVPRKVLIRVRAVFKRPTVFRVDPREPHMEQARGDIDVGSIAVATLPSRNSILLLSVHDATGLARIFFAPSHCRHG